MRIHSFLACVQVGHVIPRHSVDKERKRFCAGVLANFVAELLDVARRDPSGRVAVPLQVINLAASICTHRSFRSIVRRACMIDRQCTRH